MLKRLFVHNYKCFENFMFEPSGALSLLIGKNGTGKSSVRTVLELFQKIGRGEHEVKNLIDPTDTCFGNSSAPVRFEMDVELNNRLFSYTWALELPHGFKIFRILEEKLVVDGKIIFSRQNAQVSLQRNTKNMEARFLVDWHFLALPLIEVQQETEAVDIFKKWLARMVILAPIPLLIKEEVKGMTYFPERTASNMVAWQAQILSEYPAAYTKMNDYLKLVFPDFSAIQQETTGTDTKRLKVKFSSEKKSLVLSLNDLSDGEKCLLLSAVVLAAQEVYGPLFCFWDEPDSFLSLSEIGAFISTLRSDFRKGGQLIITSHHEETLRNFPTSEIVLLERSSHLEPTRPPVTIEKLQASKSISRDFIKALIAGESMQ